MTALIVIAVLVALALAGSGGGHTRLTGEPDVPYETDDE